MAKFEQAGDRLVEHYYIDDFQAATDRTAWLWKQFTPVEPPEKGSLEGELLERVSDWAFLKAQDSPTGKSER